MTDGESMHVAALRQLSKTAAQLTEPAPVIDPESELMIARLLRCECRSCGAHTNAMATTDADGTCPNCGAPGLVPVEGAGLIRTL
jgi:rubrerythrin